MAAVPRGQCWASTTHGGLGKLLLWYQRLGLARTSPGDTSLAAEVRDADKKKENNGKRSDSAFAFLGQQLHTCPPGPLQRCALERASGQCRLFQNSVTCSLKPLKCRMYYPPRSFKKKRKNAWNMSALKYKNSGEATLGRGHRESLSRINQSSSKVRLYLASRDSITGNDSINGK